MTDDAPPPPRRPPVAWILALALLAVASTGWRGYRFGGSNQSLQIPLLKHLAEPELYRHDPVLSSFEGYPSFFFHALVPAVQAAGLAHVYFFLYIAAHLASLAALLALARRLFASSAVGLVAAFLYIGAVPSLGAEFTYWPRLTHAHVAGAVLLWALYFHLRDRPRLAWALAGIAFDIHALYALHVAVLMAADSAWRWRERGLRALALDGVVFVGLAAPALLWILGRHDPVSSAEWPLWLEIMRRRSGPHTFPLSVPAGVYVRYLLLLAAAGLAWRAAPLDGPRRPVLRYALAVAALCAIGFVFSELLPVRRVIEAQLLRSTKWLTVFVLLWIARLIVDSWSWGGLARMAGGFTFAGLLAQQPAWLVLGLALYLVAHAHRFPLPALVLGGVSLVLAAVSQAAPLPERLGLHPLMLALESALERPAVIACIVGFAVWRAASDLPGRAGRLVSLAAAAGALAFALPWMYREHLQVVDAEPWNDVQSWAREHTPRDAVLLTPPHREGFRVFSDRAIVGEWKDGTQQFFSWAFAREWEVRMRDVGADDAAAYDALGAARLAEIAQRYGADYAVVSAPSALGFDRVYENEEFAVYRIPRSGATAAR